ncbi:hypothetical protein D3C84_1043740 [compost metagenome]
MAIADNDWHQTGPPGAQAGWRVPEDRIVIVDSFHTQSMELIRLVVANLKGDNQ